LSPNQTREDGGTPLFEATKYGHMACAKLLIQAGVDIHHQNSKGETALMEAADWDENRMMAYLLVSGAKADLTSKEAGINSPLLLCVQNRNLEGVKLLVEHGAPTLYHPSERSDNYALPRHQSLLVIQKYLYQMELDKAQKIGNTVRAKELKSVYPNAMQSLAHKLNFERCNFDDIVHFYEVFPPAQNASYEDERLTPTPSAATDKILDTKLRGYALNFTVKNLLEDENDNDWKQLQQRKKEKQFNILKQKVFQRDNFTCQFCGFQSQDFMEIIPLAKKNFRHRQVSLSPSALFV